MHIIYYIYIMDIYIYTQNQSEAAFTWCNYEHGIFGAAAKKKEIEVALRYVCVYIYIIL